ARSLLLTASVPARSRPQRAPRATRHDRRSERALAALQNRRRRADTNHHGPFQPRSPRAAGGPSPPRRRSLSMSPPSLLLPPPALPLAPAAAQAATPVIGYGDQRAQMFSDPLFTGLGIRDSRVVVEWDTFRYPDKTARLDAWMAAAKAAHVRPLVAIEHSWTAGRERLAPTPAQYTALIRRLRARYPEVRTLSPWDEANHPSPPTARQ